MGQYWKVYVELPNVKPMVFNTDICFEKDNIPEWAEDYLYGEGDNKYYSQGCKLMEHSWIDCAFAEQFSLFLYEYGPARVVWCGDYAKPDECKALGFEYSTVWGTDNSYPEVDKLMYIAPKDLDKVKYFVNRTKKLYLDLEKYKKNSTYVKKYSNGEYTECIYPVSLLTALGNDRGLGDYHEGYPGYEQVGSWAGDLVDITDEKPEGYEEFTVKFMEKKEGEE